jgi:hypothetical protein
MANSIKKVTVVRYTQDGVNYTKTLPDMPKGSIEQAMLRYGVGRGQITGHEFRAIPVQ